MNSFYSIIRFVSNQWSSENLAVGLLVVSGDELFFRVSERKLRLAKSINPTAQKLLKFSLNQLKSFVEGEKKLIRESNYTKLPLEKSKLNQAFVERLHRYSKGVLQFSTPEFIGTNFDEALFHKYFQKMVDGIEKLEKEGAEVSEFHRKIIRELHDPLKEKVDVDYHLEKDAFNLYFDFTMDNIGVNGSIIATASIDLNHDRIGGLQKKLAEYETVVSRLEHYAQQKGIGSDHTFYLIADEYKGKTLSNMELAAHVSKGIDGKFQRITTSELHKVIQTVNKKKATKFSEFIAG